MTVSLSFRHFASDQQDVRLSLPIPMVYEDLPAVPVHWEYRMLTIDTREQELPGEAELNELGKEGWLLVGMLEQPTRQERGLVHYYFVRQQLEK